MGARARLLRVVKFFYGRLLVLSCEQRLLFDSLDSLTLSMRGWRAHACDVRWRPQYVQSRRLIDEMAHAALTLADTNEHVFNKGPCVWR